MKKNFRPFFLAIVMFLSCNLDTHASTEDLIDQLLDSLDIAIANRQAAIDRQEAQAVAMAREADAMPVSLAKAQAYCHTSEAFMHLSSDSAIKYAMKEYDVVMAIKDQKQLLFTRLDLFKAYIRRGDTGKAFEIGTQIGDISSLQDPQAQEIYAQHMLDLYVRLQNDGNAYSNKVIKTADAWTTYSPYLKKGSALYYYYQGLYSGKLDLKPAIDVLNNTPETSNDYPKLAITIAREYARLGDADEFYTFLLRSAITDVKQGNTEMSSLLYLLETPLLEKDTKRSYKYVRVLTDNVIRYHDMSRELRVVEIQSRINKQFNDQIHIFRIIGSIALFFLVVALIFYIIQSNMLKKQLKQPARKR